MSDASAEFSLRDWALIIADTFDAQVTSFESRGKGGQHCNSVVGEFGNLNLNPCAIVRMRQHAREIRAAQKREANAS